MKKTNLLILIIAFIKSTLIMQAQTLNWESLQPEQKNIASIDSGYEYAFVFGAAYGYSSSLFFPVVYQIEFSIPAGLPVLDDFKTKIGGNILWLGLNDFRFSTDIKGVFRKYENAYVQMLNFGCDFSGSIGFYKPTWFIAGQAGLDKAIATNFQHSKEMHGLYADIQNGWYQPPTGGNFYCGLQGGVSFHTYDITAKGGRMVNDNFNTTPLINYYAMISVNKKW